MCTSAKGRRRVYATFDSMSQTTRSGCHAEQLPIETGTSGHQLPVATV
jgi:hypothetical protein